MMYEPKNTERGYVALLAEGVDRNIDTYLYNVLNIVALLAEGVDRNRKAGE